MFNHYSLSVTVTFVFKVNLNKFENWYKNEMKMFSFFVDLLRFIEKATETNNNEILSCTYAEMPTSGELESGDPLFFNPPPPINMGMPEDII